MQHLRLSHPELDFWVDVRHREFDGKRLAVADLVGTPASGLGDAPQEEQRPQLGRTMAEHGRRA